MTIIRVSFIRDSFIRVLGVSVSRSDSAYMRDFHACGPCWSVNCPGRIPCSRGSLILDFSFPHSDVEIIGLRKSRYKVCSLDECELKYN